MAILSVKAFPDELLRFLKIKAAQDSTTLRDIVIGIVSELPGAPAAKLPAPKPRGRRPREFTPKPGWQPSKPQ